MRCNMYVYTLVVLLSMFNNHFNFHCDRICDRMRKVVISFKLRVHLVRKLLND